MCIYFPYWKAILLLMILRICFTFKKKSSGTMVGRTQVLKSWIQYSNQTQSQCDTNNNNPCWNTKIGVFLIWNHIFSWYTRGWCIKFATGLNIRFMTISSHFVANYMNIFHKTEVQTVILRWWTDLKLNWFKSYVTNAKNCKNTKNGKKIHQ